MCVRSKPPHGHALGAAAERGVRKHTRISRTVTEGGVPAGPVACTAPHAYTSSTAADLSPWSARGVAASLGAADATCWSTSTRTRSTGQAHQIVALGGGSLKLGRCAVLLDDAGDCERRRVAAHSDVPASECGLGCVESGGGGGGVKGCPLPRRRCCRDLGPRAPSQHPPWRLVRTACAGMRSTCPAAARRARP